MNNEISKELTNVYFYRGKKFLTKQDAELYKAHLEEEEARNSIDDQ
jgi:hypothetical protein